MSTPLVKILRSKERPLADSSTQLENTADGDLVVHGFVSGVRSALVQSSSCLSQPRWYRLKGCGMPDGSGFPVIPVLNDNQDPVTIAVSKPVDHSEDGTSNAIAANVILRKIRGAAYPHTANIELCMTSRVNTVLEDVADLRTGNKPLGRWDFDSHEKMQLPLATRSCVVSETVGDRRLGDHLLRGLEMLLPLMLSPHVDLVTSCVVDLLDGTGMEGMTREKDSLLVLIDGGDDESEFHAKYIVADVENWDEFDSRLPAAMLLFGGGASCPADIFTDPSGFETSSDCDSTHTKKIIGLSIPTSSQFPSSAPDSLRGVWDRACRKLSSFSESFSSTPTENASPWLGDLLGSLYWRLGHEVGVVGRLLSLF